MTIVQKLEQKGRLEGLQLVEVKVSKEGKRESISDVRLLYSDHHLSRDATMQMAGLMAADLTRIGH